MTDKLDWNCNAEGAWSAELPDGRTVWAYWDDSDPVAGVGWAYRITPAHPEDEDREDYSEESGSLDGCEDMDDYAAALRAAEEMVR